MPINSTNKIREPVGYGNRKVQTAPTVGRTSNEGNNDNYSIDSKNLSPSMSTASISNSKPPIDGLAKELTLKSGKSHIERQMKARKEKEDQQNRLKWKFKTNTIPTGGADQSTTKQISIPPLDNPSGFLNMQINDSSDTNDRRNSISSQLQYNNDYTNVDLPDMDEPIVELLERERREWHEERMKLLQCLHLQQLELDQRSMAAHEKAADIAKEFAKAIEGFEERLVSVETTVQKEIMAIKLIAESLKSSVSLLLTHQQGNQNQNSN
uniref:Uncharacterized protein n=1 Tax=Chromulina nebulosa TaxID=96789 RepID=A0A7S0XDF2_9STRA|mmetsp:Transcript_3380/g.3003  ORF Transcript_3380/g.3003 Transcript_3380/m.3003 type:complete len:267 (+) Transcript_3380:21-821(+)